MTSQGIKTNNLALASSLTELIVNTDAGTARLPLSTLAAVLGASIIGAHHSTRDALYADTQWAAGAVGYVYSDTTSRNGIYKKTSASGQAGWTRIGDLPSNVASASEMADLRQAFTDLCQLQLASFDDKTIAQQDVTPGSRPAAFTLDVGGDPETSTPIISNPAVTTKNGSVLSKAIGKVAMIDGADVTIAKRYPMTVQTGLIYKVSFSFYRDKDPDDPLNDAIEVGLVPLGADYTVSGESYGVQNVIVTRNDGTRTVTFTFGHAHPVAEQPEVLLPDSVTMVRPYIRTYGTSHRTGIRSITAIDATDVLSLNGALDVVKLAQVSTTATEAAEAARANREDTIEARDATLSAAEFTYKDFADLSSRLISRGDGTVVSTRKERFSYVENSSSEFTVNGVGLSPAGDKVPASQTGDDLAKAKAFASGAAAKRAVLLEGTGTLSTAITYDNSRCDTWHGATDISNLMGGGAYLNYTGSGKAAHITAGTEASPSVLTTAGHDFVTGDVVYVYGATGGGWPRALNGGPWTIANVVGDSFSLKDAEGSYFSGVGLGTMTGSAYVRTPDAMAAFHLTGSFAQSYKGMTIEATGNPDAVVWIGARDDFGGTDTFSGSLTRFDGVQFRPGDDVKKANVVVENHKFATFGHAWFAPGLTNKTGLHLGTSRNNSYRTLLSGSSYLTAIRDSFLFANVALERVSGLLIQNTQFDGHSDPIRLYTVDGGQAGQVRYDTFLIHNNNGAADGTGLAAIHQGPADQKNEIVLPYTGAWALDAGEILDWPIGYDIGAGMTRISATQFRGRDPGNIGVIVREDARGEIIDASNDFSQMFTVGNVGILDLRYKSLTIDAATQTNPVMLTFASGHHLENGDRIRIENVGGMTELNGPNGNGNEYIVAGRTDTTITLKSVDDAGSTSVAVDGTGFGTFTSGGTVTRPYMWHRKNFGGRLFSVGHSDMVFDLELAQSAELGSGTTNVLSMLNVPIVGGHYEISYGAVVNCNSVPGQVRFEVSIANNSYAPSSFISNDDVGERSHFYQRRLYIPADTNINGSIVRFKCYAQNTATLRGRNATVAGATFCQIRRVG